MEHPELEGPTGISSWPCTDTSATEGVKKINSKGSYCIS